MIKLNLGCGPRQIHNYINVDIDPKTNPDRVDDMRTLSTFKENEVELIYCSHVLEHFLIKETVPILKRWYKILKPGGILRVAVPDMDKVFRHYIYYKDLVKLHTFLWGSQEDHYQIHKSGWTFDTLKSILMSIGFTEVKRYNWRDLEHHYVDDHSQGYLPHMDKETGVLMSLNIEAKKI